MADELNSLLLNSARHGLFLHDEAFRFISVNPAGAALLGYPREVLLQMSLSDIEPDFNRNGIDRRLQALRNGERITTTGRPLRSDGYPIPVEVMVTALETDQRRLYAVDVRPLDEPALPHANHRLKDLATALLASLQELQLTRHEGRPSLPETLEDISGIAAALIVEANRASLPSPRWPDLREVLTHGQIRTNALTHSTIMFTPPREPIQIAMTMPMLEEAMHHVLSTATSAAAERGEPIVHCTVTTAEGSALCRFSPGVPRSSGALTVARHLLAACGGQILFEEEALLLVLPLATA